MSRSTRIEVLNLIKKAQLQVEQAKELQRQLEDLAVRIEKDERDKPKATTKHRIPK